MPQFPQIARQFEITEINSWSHCGVSLNLTKDSSMSDELLETNCFVTLLGAGKAPDADISAALALAPELVAADGGANRALEYGIQPQWVVGQFTRNFFKE